VESGQGRGELFKKYFVTSNTEIAENTEIYLTFALVTDSSHILASDHK
jgi:hypothetical protein